MIFAIMLPTNRPRITGRRDRRSLIAKSRESTTLSLPASPVSQAFCLPCLLSIFIKFSPLFFRFSPDLTRGKQQCVLLRIAHSENFFFQFFSNYCITFCVVMQHLASLRLALRLFFIPMFYNRHLLHALAQQR
nr:MAG TPA: hypothetical protein [Caudoviricetes sp.]